MPISYFIWGKYHTRSFILVFLAHFVLCSFSLRADPFFYFDYIDDTYGLTNSSIEAIAQDKDGYMWFGTQEGIFQFDGLQSVKYYQDNKQGSLLDDDIFDLLITEENELWVATSSAGIARFDRKSETFTHITDTTYPLKISHYRVTTIIEVDDKIWLHTQKGIETINKYDLQIENIPLIYESNELAEYDSSSLVYFNESVWTVYKGKLFRTSQDGNRFIEYEFTEKNNDLNSNEIFRIYATKMRMILHMKGGLYELNKTEPLGLTILDTKIVIDNNVKIQSVIEDDYGTVWMTIYGEGLFFKIKGNMEFNHVHSGIARNQLNTKAVIAIYQDDSNNIWLGTDGNFLVKFRSPFKLFPFTTNLYSPDENLQTHGIWSILEFNEDFYIGTENGVFKYKESEALLSP
ncbi:MAG: hypothetical protein KJO88_02605, partial [Gammaproteobacteria bacterium]|nr:hypothetical protein [Gammaproteobacteria bacterium]